MYSLVSLLLGIYPLLAMHSLLATLYVTKYLIIQIWIQYSPFKRDFVTLNKSVINYLPRCTYHLLYLISNTKMLTQVLSSKKPLTQCFYSSTTYCRE